MGDFQMAIVTSDQGLAWALTQFNDGRNVSYQRYEDYLAGKQPLAFATERFESAFGKLFRAFAYNRCPAVVDAHADRLQVAGFGADNAKLSQEAQDLWDDNLMDVREGHVYADQFGDGDAYVLVDVNPESGKVQYWTQNPKLIRVHWDDETPNTIDLAAKAWTTDDRRTRVNLYWSDRIEKYVSRNTNEAGMPKSPIDYDPYEVEGEQWPVMLPVPDTVPVFHFANNGRTNQYGASELQSILPLQDAMNKAFMDMFVAMEMAAFPQRVLIGVDEPTTEEGRKLVEAFEGGLDRIFGIGNENAKVAEFSAVDIAQYLKVIETVDKTISRVSRVPVHYLEMSGDFPSGRAMRLSETPFTKKMLDRQRANGAVWAELQRYGLRCRGLQVEPGSIRTNWETVDASSAEDTWDLIRLKIDAGMALPSALREAGYEPKQIAAIELERASEYERIGDYAPALPLSSQRQQDEAVDEAA